MKPSRRRHVEAVVVCGCWSADGTRVISLLEIGVPLGHGKMEMGRAIVGEKGRQMVVLPFPSSD